MNGICEYCQDGYVKKNGVLRPCQHCITPDRFQTTIETAIKNCVIAGDGQRKHALKEIANNLPDYPIMALLEAEHYGGFTKDFIEMMKDAYQIKPFKDVDYKGIA
jgi:hypothetical protein